MLLRAILSDATTFRTSMHNHAWGTFDFQDLQQCQGPAMMHLPATTEHIRTLHKMT